MLIYFGMAGSDRQEVINTLALTTWGNLRPAEVQWLHTLQFYAGSLLQLWASSSLPFSGFSSSSFPGPASPPDSSPALPPDCVSLLGDWVDLKTVTPKQNKRSWVLSTDRASFLDLYHHLCSCKTIVKHPQIPHTLITRYETVFNNFTVLCLLHYMFAFFNVSNKFHFNWL